MRIRLALTLEVNKAQPVGEEQHLHPDTESLVEHAGPQRIGFTIQPHDPDPFPDDRLSKGAE